MNELVKANKYRDGYKPERDERGRFQKGSSGFPGGAWANYTRTKRFANNNLADYLNLIHRIITGDEPSDMGYRVTLLKEMLNRAEGRVATQVNITTEVKTPDMMSRDELVSRLKQTESQLKEIEVHRKEILPGIIATGFQVGSRSLGEEIIFNEDEEDERDEDCIKEGSGEDFEAKADKEDC